jgi:uncharacterized FlaG/YvyC family protein
MIDETADLESQTFTLTLSGEYIKVIMNALHFTHGFMGGVDAEIQEQTVQVNNAIVDQVTQQIPEEEQVEDGEF